jgi:hypothetical protein
VPTPAAARLRMHAGSDEATLWIVRATAQSCADDFAVQLSHEGRAIGWKTRLEILHGPRGLVRENGALDPNPLGEVRVRFCAPDLDHPSRSACPRSGPVEGVRGNREIPPATRIA